MICNCAIETKQLIFDENTVICNDADLIIPINLLFKVNKDMTEKEFVDVLGTTKFMMSINDCYELINDKIRIYVLLNGVRKFDENLFVINIPFGKWNMNYDNMNYYHDMYLSKDKVCFSLTETSEQIIETSIIVHYGYFEEHLKEKIPIQTLESIEEKFSEEKKDVMVKLCFNTLKSIKSCMTKGLFIETDINNIKRIKLLCNGQCRFDYNYLFIKLFCVQYDGMIFMPFDSNVSQPESCKHGLFLWRCNDVRLVCEFETGVKELNIHALQFTYVKKP